MKELIKNKKIILLGIGGILIIIFLIGIHNTKNDIVETESEELGLLIDNTEKITNSNKIYIDIKGSVKTPGVYELDENSHVIDAITIAGGLTKTANTRYINLSKTLKDNDVIIINSNSEINKMKKSEQKECICEQINQACIQNENIITSEINKSENKESQTQSETNENKKININTATLEELMTLTGIGEAKANNILEYRKTNGNFNSIEDIKNVSGISDTIYDKIKENITI